LGSTRPTRILTLLSCLVIAGCASGFTVVVTNDTASEVILQDFSDFRSAWIVPPTSERKVAVPASTGGRLAILSTDCVLQDTISAYKNSLVHVEVDLDGRVTIESGPDDGSAQTVLKADSVAGCEHWDLPSVE
jgi:hypothetical protein